VRAYLWKYLAKKTDETLWQSVIDPMVPQNIAPEQIAYEE
jgi:hypothetical protein